MNTLRARYHREVIDSFPNGVLVLFDDDLRYQIVGPEILPFSKRNAAEMEGKTIYELFPEATAAQLELELQATIDGTPRSFDVNYEERTHHLETQPVNIDGEAYGVLVTQDVSVARQTTAELKQQTKRLESVAYLLSHDLRNPLTTAQGYLEIEREERGLSDPLETVERALLRIEGIIDDLMDLARATEDQVDVEPVRVSAVATDAWEMVDTANATLDIDSEKTILADRSRLQRIFENLFRNAVEHGSAEVSVSVGDLNTGFYIEDDGPGIPSEMRDDVFDIGYSTRDEGTGFGLNIVEAIVKGHGWEIQVQESSAGGARFEVHGVDFY